MRDWLHLAITGVALLIATTLLVEWRSDVRDRAKLQATLDQAEQSLQRANAAQQDRDRQLNDAVGKIEALKASVLTQQQILTRLPDVLPLPKPIAEEQAGKSAVASDVHGGGAATRAEDLPKAPSPGTATIPSEDLKPLYDFAVDCKACQVRLAAATADLSDEKVKTQALSRERDAALKLAHGGSLRQRFGHAMKWFVVGAVAGAIASKAH
jgi:TolA-binding protein